MGLAEARAARRYKQIFVCLDNASVVDGLNRFLPESWRNMFICFKELATRREPDVEVEWIHRHKDIEGNEAADKLAKNGTVIALSIASPLTAGKTID